MQSRKVWNLCSLARGQTIVMSTGTLDRYFWPWAHFPNLTFLQWALCLWRLGVYLEHLCTPGKAELMLLERTAERGLRFQAHHILIQDSLLTDIRSAVLDWRSKDAAQHPLWVWNYPIGFEHQPIWQAQLQSPYFDAAGHTAPLSEHKCGGNARVKRNNTLQLHSWGFITGVKYLQKIVWYRLLWRIQERHLI